MSQNSLASAASTAACDSELVCCRKNCIATIDIKQSVFSLPTELSISLPREPSDDASGYLTALVEHYGSMRSVCVYLDSECSGIPIGVCETFIIKKLGMRRPTFYRHVASYKRRMGIASARKPLPTAAAEPDSLDSEEGETEEEEDAQQQDARGREMDESARVFSMRFDVDSLKVKTQEKRRLRENRAQPVASVAEVVALAGESLGHVDFVFPCLLRWPTQTDIDTLFAAIIKTQLSTIEEKRAQVSVACVASQQQKLLVLRNRRRYEPCLLCNHAKDDKVFYDSDRLLSAGMITANETPSIHVSRFTVANVAQRGIGECWQRHVEAVLFGGLAVSRVVEMGVCRAAYPRGGFTAEKRESVLFPLDVTQFWRVFVATSGKRNPKCQPGELEVLGDSTMSEVFCEPLTNRPVHESYFAQQCAERFFAEKFADDVCDEILIHYSGNDGLHAELAIKHGRAKPRLDLAVHLRCSPVPSGDVEFFRRSVFRGLAVCGEKIRVRIASLKNEYLRTNLRLASIEVCMQFIYGPHAYGERFVPFLYDCMFANATIQNYRAEEEIRESGARKARESDKFVEAVRLLAESQPDWIKRRLLPEGKVSFSRATFAARAAFSYNMAQPAGPNYRAFADTAMSLKFSGGGGAEETMIATIFAVQLPSSFSTTIDVSNSEKIVREAEQTIARACSIVPYALPTVDDELQAESDRLFVVKMRIKDSTVWGKRVFPYYQAMQSSINRSRRKRKVDNGEE